MLMLPLGPLSSDWFEFARSLIGDLAPLGHRLQRDEDGITLFIEEPSDHEDKFWEPVHQLQHYRILLEHRDEILAFERDYEAFFVDPTTFQPTAVQPILQVVNFKNPDQMRVLEYLRLSQSVTAGRPVGRRMGLLIWDIGQAGGPKIFGGAMLASARFSQRIRDQRFGWPPDYPKTSSKHDSVARALRVTGLGRIMQLSMACAVPPYSVLSGARLVALAPFTAAGLESFRRSLKVPDVHADLAAIVTTTGKGISGSPFHGHRVGQLAPGVVAAEGARGDLYAKVKVPPEINPLRASFESLVGDSTRARALTLFRAEKPERYAQLRRPERSAMAYCLRRLGLRRWIYEGNEIGVHLGILGSATLPSLQSGKPRSSSNRPLIDWDQAVGVWSRRFLPAPENVGESADEDGKAAHRKARQARLERARELNADSYRLSSRLADTGCRAVPIAVGEAISRV